MMTINTTKHSPQYDSIPTGGLRHIAPSVNVDRKNKFRYPRHDDQISQFIKTIDSKSGFTPNTNNNILIFGYHIKDF